MAVLEAQKIAVSYGRREVVHGVNLMLDPAASVGLIGESGSGKTTIGLATMGYARDGCRIDAGRVRVGDTEVLALDAAGLRGLRGRRVAAGVRMLVVPGSEIVKRDAEAEGIHEIVRAAGAEWREPGCSMCLGMNPDQLKPGQRCASTSNRNFEGRQGRGGRTHLVSPAMAAAAAVSGHLEDIRKLI